MTDPTGPAGALCAAHPDRPAVAGTCVRCGSFLCDECRVQESAEPMCAACYQRRYGARIVRQVPALGVVLMVHGALLVLMAGFLAIYGVSLGISFGSMPAPDPAADPLAPDHRWLEDVMLWTMVVMAVVHGGAGAIQLFAGWHIRTFRSRGLGIAAVFAGLGGLIGCYCGLTAIGLLVWGLVVLLHPAVAERFAAVRRSATNAA